MKTEILELPGAVFENIYNRYYMSFEPIGMFTFHNLLWQLIVNEVKKDQKVVLSTSYEVNGQELVFVFDGEKGYSKTHVAFLSNINYKKAHDIAMDLNLLIFKIEPKKAERIISNSF